MRQFLCWLLSGHIRGKWRDYTEPPFADGRSFEVRRCVRCGGAGEVRAKPIPLARIDEAAARDGIKPDAWTDEQYWDFRTHMVERR